MSEPTPQDEVGFDSDPTPVIDTRNGERANQAVEQSERGMPELGRQRGPRRAWWCAPLLVISIVIAGAAWAIHGFLQRHDAAEKARRDALQDAPPQGRVFGDPPAASASTAAVSSVPARAAAASSVPVLTPRPARERTAPVRSYFDAPLLLAGSAGASNEPPNGGPERAASSSDVPSSLSTGSVRRSQGDSPLAQMLTPSSTPRVRAGLLGNRSLILAQGAKIDCAGDTAFDSTEAGISTCTVTNNVYSDDGRVELIERGSQINSEYRSNLAPGQKRVFILSARIKTPQGVTVQIDSPAADALGRMGVSGDVNNHWAERFGAAMLIGLMHDAIGYLATRGGNSNGSVVFENTQQEGSELASRALDSTINIAPTLSQSQGAAFTIVLARDLDFSSVYALEPEGTP